MTSVWVASTTWYLSNDTKALFADEFVDKDYSIYTEMLWQTLCVLYLYLSTLKTNLCFAEEIRTNFVKLVLEKHFWIFSQGGSQPLSGVLRWACATSMNYFYTTLFHFNLQ